MNQRTWFAPSEGWLTLGLVMLLCSTLAFSIDDVALVLGRGDFTDFLFPMSILGVLAGFIGPQVGWGRWQTYAIGSIFAALLVPLIVGTILLPAGGPFVEAYSATADSTRKAVTDLLVQNMDSTTEFGHYLLALGLLVWATSMFASYAVFGHHHPLNAVVVVGLVMLINMSITPLDQLNFLVVYSVAALFLLVRFHVFDEESEWVRRHIGDPGSLSWVYLRGGTIFIVGAIAGSLLLTMVARSAPLEGAWSGFGSGLIEMSRGLQRFLPTGGNTRPIGNDFDPNSTSIRGIWNPNGSLAMTVHLPRGDRESYYWRAVAFDEYTINGWRVSDPVAIERATGAGLLEGSHDAADQLVSKPLTFTVDPAGGSGPLVISPWTPTVVDRPTTVRAVGEGAYLNAIEARGGGPYTVTALLRREGDGPGELNQAALREAGQVYPPEIVERFTAVPPTAIPPGGNAEKLLDQLVAEAGTTNPFDLATYMQQQFRRSGPDALFQYDTDVLDLMVSDCKDISIVECFATFRHGFCQYYATTMAMFLRAEGIPTRIVEGFLPSARGTDGIETVLASSRHEWVEVYFPGFGWVMFDPTGGGVSRQEALPTGKPLGSARPLTSFGLFTGPPLFDPRDEQASGADGAGLTSRRGPIGPLIAVGVLLVIVVGALAFLAWQRGPRSGTTADQAYRTVTRLAGRFGFAAKPTQTVYEFTGSLGEVLPTVRPELETVARAKVETTYGREILGAERLASLRHAERRLRLNLLRLAFRRPRRRPR